MRILIIDNKDSFTYNLAHYVEEYTSQFPDVIRHNDFDVSMLKLYGKVIFSPGPGVPGEYPIMNHVLDRIQDDVPVLGVCLGMQALAEYYGGQLINLGKVSHGKSKPVYILNSEDPILKNIPSPFMAGRYHSWVVDHINLPEKLKASAIDADNNLMAIRHIKKPQYGIQFHPESIMTPAGKEIIKNWLNIKLQTHS